MSCRNYYILTNQVIEGMCALVHPYPEIQLRKNWPHWYNTCVICHLYETCKTFPYTYRCIHSNRKIQLKCALLYAAIQQAMKMKHSKFYVHSKKNSQMMYKTTPCTLEYV